MTTLKVGDPAPEIKALDQDGKQISLNEYRDKKVILYFYPKDMTPGCTVESINLRDNYDDLKNKGYEVIGVSIDSQKRHQKFISQNNLPFRLIADEDKKVVTDYGVWGEKKMMGRTYEGIFRTTFVIDGNGKIEKIFTKVITKDHTNQILNS